MYTDTDTKELIQRAIEKMRRERRRKPFTLFQIATPESLEEFCSGLVLGEESTTSLIKVLRTNLRKQFDDRCVYRFARRFTSAYVQLKEESELAKDRTDLLAFSIATVARRLELEIDEVERLILGGKLATINLGGIRRIPVASLRRLLALSPD